jgi:acyl-coenzyme A thioesterase PaaI-like protein
MSPFRLRLLLNLYPPYWATGIRVARIAPDFRVVEVAMPLRWYNRNRVGTHFGGSLSAMTDPFYMLMLMEILGREYVIWDKAGTIEFRKPGTGRVVARFEIDQPLIDRIVAATADGDKYQPTLAVDIRDEAGDVVAYVTRTLHVRRKRQALPEARSP